uniref:ATP synthase F0 subunit 8 n=1 Tax=Gilpinia tabulaeformis TaxID=2982312 RepID=UPI0023F0F096|nr:ATP synthase F0 subunit 8 [Gilpinia tabulaeformis]WDY84708.1 ATP synthase F0 subunit 8 [Gilpinia tabulaeformis]
MPQMYPMNWILLLIFITIMFTLMMIIFYYFKTPLFKKMIYTKNKKNINLNWKW